MKLLSIDLFLGDRFFTTFTHRFLVIDGRISVSDVLDVAKRKFPSVRNRSDLHIFFNNL